MLCTPKLKTIHILFDDFLFIKFPSLKVMTKINNIGFLVKSGLSLKIFDSKLYQ